MRAHVEVREGRTFYEYRADETARETCDFTSDAIYKAFKFEILYMYSTFLL